MSPDTIKFKTIQFINGTKYLLGDQVEQVKNTMCYNLKIERTEENLAIIEEAINVYFEAQNSLSI